MHNFLFLITFVILCMSSPLYLAQSVYLSHECYHSILSHTVGCSVVTFCKAATDFSSLSVHGPTGHGNEEGQ